MDSLFKFGKRFLIGSSFLLLVYVIAPFVHFQFATATLFISLGSLVISILGSSERIEKNRLDNPNTRDYFSESDYQNYSFYRHSTILDSFLITIINYFLPFYICTFILYFR